MFTQNNHFFKPQRLVWQNSGLENSNASETSEVAEDVSWDEALKAVDFKNSAKKLCDAGEQHICILAEESDINKTVKLKTFIDELGEKFLNKIPERKYKTAKNSVKRFQLLQEVADMEAIMERFKEAENYEIKSYQRGKNPTMIVFNYPPDEENPEGTMEEYPLEMSFQKKRDVIKKSAKALKVSAEKQNKIISLLSGLTENSNELEKKVYEEDLAQRRDAAREDDAVREEIIIRSSSLDTPDRAYDELINIAPSIDNNVLEELSIPLSEMALMWSGAEVDYEHESVINLNGDRMQEITGELENILKRHYGENYIENMSPEQRKDLQAMGNTFGID